MPELLKLLEDHYKGTITVAPVSEGISFEPGYQCDQCQCDCHPGPPGG